MPLVTAQARENSNGDIVTEFIDSVGTTATTWTYPTTQNRISVMNEGDDSITVVVGGKTQVIQRGKSWEANVDFTSVTINSSSKTQQIRVLTKIVYVFNAEGITAVLEATGDLKKADEIITSRMAKNEKKVLDYLYNMIALKKFLGTKFPKNVFWGDSITAGAGSDFWYSSWVSQFSDTIQLTRGSMYGRGYVTPIDGGTPSGWTLETKGVNQYRIISDANPLTAVGSHSRTDRTVDILYSKELDGGSFNVTIDDVIVATASCAGTTSYGNKLTIEIPKTKIVMVVPTGKTYIEGYIHYNYGGVTNGVLTHKVGHGGFKASEFSDAEIKATIKTFTPDLTCIGHIVNDVGDQKPDIFKAKITVAILAGKETGDVLLYIPCRGKLEEEVQRQYPYDLYKDILYSLADQYDCAVIDFDKFIGGYAGAVSKGLLVDAVHPNQKGYDLMASIAISALIPDAVSSKYSIAHSGNLGNYYDMLIQFPSYLGRLRVVDNLLFEGILNGFTAAINGETYLRVNKMKIVNDGTADFIALENYGSSGSIITMNDKTQPNKIQIRNVNNLSYLLSGRSLEIDTTDANKFGNFTKIKNFLIAESGIQIGAPVATSVLNNSFFLEAGVLKFKDSAGVVKIVTLT